MIFLVHEEMGATNVSYEPIKGNKVHGVCQWGTSKRQLFGL